MLCIFCGENHLTDHFMCPTRQRAAIDRLVMLTTRPRKMRQPTIREAFKRVIKTEFVIENLEPIVIDDSEDEEDIMPHLSLISERSFLDTLDSDEDDVSSPIVANLTPPPTLPRTPIKNPLIASSQAELEAQWPCIQNTINDPIARSKARTRAQLKSYIMERMGTRQPIDVLPSEWISWLITWSLPRGRCKYGDKTTGISPASAKIFFRLLVHLLEHDFAFLLLIKHPFLYKFPRNWQKSITKERRYARKQAGFFSQDDIRLYIQLFSTIVDEGSDTDMYYAAMARVVISISMLFAGCRLGELLSAKLSQIQFVTVRNQMAVAITSLGTKSDVQNQRSSPITFGTLNDKPLCPMHWFGDWIQRNDWTVEGCKLTSSEDEFLFPLLNKREKFISTSYFTSKESLNINYIVFNLKIIILISKNHKNL